MLLIAGEILYVTDNRKNIMLLIAGGILLLIAGGILCY